MMNYILGNRRYDYFEKWILFRNDLEYVSTALTI